MGTLDISKVQENRHRRGNGVPSKHQLTCTYVSRGSQCRSMFRVAQSIPITSVQTLSIDRFDCEGNINMVHPTVHLCFPKDHLTG